MSSIGLTLEHFIKGLFKGPQTLGEAVAEIDLATQRYNDCLNDFGIQILVSQSLMLESLRSQQVTIIEKLDQGIEHPAIYEMLYNEIQREFEQLRCVPFS